jgi:transcriptional regulator with XRE-family HTH domain
MSNIKINNKAYQIGSKIKKAREEAGMTQAELGKYIGGYSSMAISYFENGEREVKIDVLAKIADALSRNIEYFLEPFSQSDETASITSAYFRRGAYDLSPEERKKEDVAIKNFKEHIKNLKNNS